MRHVFVVLLMLTAASATAMSTPVEQLPTGCVAGSTSCPKTYDSTSGVCRTIRFSTSAGDIQVLVCDKGDHYELYRQTAPTGLTFKACTGGGSVDQMSGFSSFTSTALAAGCGTTTTQSLVDPNSAGFAGETRAANHERLLGVWWNDGRLVQRFACTYGTCAWVPWYSVSHSCALGDLQPLSKCGGSGSATLQDNCMVTDEFSQVMLATAQGTNEQRMLELYNTLRVIASGSNGGLFETLPAWRARQTNGAINVGSSGSERDVASDADARVILALYIAATSPYFSSSAKTTLRGHADAMAADFLQHDFVHACRAGRNGVQICDWLAAGGNAARGGFASGNFSYAGYSGDAVIALLAAHKSTGASQYLSAARDTVEAYLLASEYYGSFRVPPKAFKWDTSVTPQRATCTDTCTGAWDDADAVRAVTMCKARYYAGLAGVSLPADLATYCTGWLNSGGVHSFEYVTQYTWGGAPNSSFQDGPFENGLGASLNFADNTADLVTRLDRVGTKWDTLNNRWYGQTCTGVYRNAFFTVNLGSAIGRDLRVFTGQ